ncbi:receptor-like kinase [Medicago truncatula]|uniref:non-specific serine/threonine protein kinase n=1 Tax=Medicago truncatula TaxID=3880 RepID=G7L9A7_MEDTR|nr:receptor-like kinase [Medicago truncatula]
MNYYVFIEKIVQIKVTRLEEELKHIIEGISQGLLYLQKYSRLKIIHKDLKANNILLDENMNAEIYDFGMARMFTNGYMSPKYAMEGICSTKSDVYSFGVLLLEIICGRKNNSFYDVGLQSCIHVGLSCVEQFAKSTNNV